MVEPEMKILVQDLLAGQPLAVLSTHQAGQPYSNLVAFAADPELEHIFFATTRATRKFANITADPRVALLIDNRANQEADFAEAAALTVLGSAREVHGPEKEQGLELLLAKHPYLRDFVSAPTCALLKVKVAKYILVSRFQEVREMSPAP
jgi:nitroimidazol reductase NimA-like FMN-containing flavoprotein (pyridoxamine 5'-phosphate oxidase superfamily)